MLLDGSVFFAPVPFWQQSVSGSKNLKGYPRWLAASKNLKLRPEFVAVRIEKMGCRKKIPGGNGRQEEMRIKETSCQRGLRSLT